MANEYKIIVQIPDGETTFTADTWNGVLNVFAKFIDVSQVDSSDVFVNLTARKAQKSLRIYYPTNHKTNAIRHHVELELIKCYIKGLTVDESIEWIKNKKNVTLSRSSVGRYWLKLRTINIDRL